MKMRILAVGLWLLSTVLGGQAAVAMDLSTGEVLRYRVFWGVFDVGSAELSYVPQGAFGKLSGYVLQARVKSETSLMVMDDVWRTVGGHGRVPFAPQRYEVVQAENDYTSDKVMLFKGKKVTYTNHKDAHDVSNPLKWDGKVRDPLGTVYAWRQNGLDALKTAGETQVVGIKRGFTLKREPAVAETLTLRGKALDVWRIEMVSTTQREGKAPQTGRWTVWLRNDADLTPVQIVARTKFGTFKARLAR